MSIQTQPNSRPTQVQNPPQTLAQKPIEKPGIGHRIKGKAAEGLGKIFDRIEQADQFIKLPGVKNPFGDRNILEVGRDVLKKIFKEPQSDKAGQEFLKKSEGFRQTLELGRSVQKQMEGMDPSNPRYESLKKALDSANTHLMQENGYTLDSAPKPGALWVSPKFLDNALPNLDMHASNFPTGKPVTKAPEAMDAVFMGRESVRLEDSQGRLREVRSPEEYRALIAENRGDFGMAKENGDPIGVHLTMEGGGGKGKRYASAICEMLRVGVVPASVSGSSAGSIGAALVAAGAMPEDLDSFVKDPALGKMYDVKLWPDDGGLMEGEKAFDLFDKKLRELTGIHDRPVTFADLKIPLKLTAAVMSDSDPGKKDMSKIENRIFTFSQETTPDTPVALAVRASISIPGVFDPVRVVDPTNGREMTLVDGGVFDNLPTNYHQPGLPEVGLSLAERGDSHPKALEQKLKEIPDGDIDATRVIMNALNGYLLHKTGGGTVEDYQDRTAPDAGNFMLHLPTWNLENPKQADSTLGFGYNDKVDPLLDPQTRKVAQDFFREHLQSLLDPKASATNSYATLERQDFQQNISVDGKDYSVAYSGKGDRVSVTDGAGKTKEVKLGQEKIEKMLYDNRSFGDLNYQLAYELEKKL